MFVLLRKISKCLCCERMYVCVSIVVVLFVIVVAGAIVAGC